jgi:type II secretory pathway pseudopilin PulG
MSAGTRTRSLAPLGVAVSLVLVGLGVSSFISAKRRSVFRREIGDMRTIGTALERYRVAHGTYPVFPARTPTLQLQPLLVPAYASSLPLNDVWAGPYFVVSSSSHYEIWSLGKDARLGPNLTDGPTEGWDADVVFRDGTFVRYPAFLDR